MALEPVKTIDLILSGPRGFFQISLNLATKSQSIRQGILHRTNESLRHSNFVFSSSQVLKKRSFRRHQLLLITGANRHFKINIDLGR